MHFYSKLVKNSLSFLLSPSAIILSFVWLSIFKDIFALRIWCPDWSFQHFKEDVIPSVFWWKVTVLQVGILWCVTGHFPWLCSRLLFTFASFFFYQVDCVRVRFSELRSVSLNQWHFQPFISSYILFCTFPLDPPMAQNSNLFLTSLRQCSFSHFSSLFFRLCHFHWSIGFLNLSSVFSVPLFSPSSECLILHVKF